MRGIAGLINSTNSFASATLHRQRRRVLITHGGLDGTGILTLREIWSRKIAVAP